MWHAGFIEIHIGKETVWSEVRNGPYPAVAHDSLEKVLPEGVIPAALWPHAVQRGLNVFVILQNVIWIHYINNVMFIGPGEQEVASTREALVRPMSYTRCRQTFRTSVKVLGVQQSGAYQNVPSKWTEVRPASPTTKKEAESRQASAGSSSSIFYSWEYCSTLFPGW